MIHLVVQFASLLLVAAICGYALGRWSIRRRFQDVTEQYNRMLRMSPEKPAVDGQVMRLLHDIESSVPKQVELGSLGDRLGNIEASVEQLQSQLGERWREQEALNRGRTESERESSGKMIARLDQIVASVSDLRRHLSASPSAAPAKAHLSSIESGAGLLPALASSGLAPRATQGNLLASASHGPKDDLQKIDGIGPKLESMLNRLGVFYFWQIAQWGEVDIAGLDAQLGAFRGRIVRDDWVRQAKSLGQAPGATLQPPTLR